MRHLASPAVARPSCQTLGLARRTRIPACFCSHPSPARRPSVNLGRRTIAALQAVSSRTLRPAARLRGQRTIGSAHTKHSGVLHAVVALSSAHDRTLFSGRLALPSHFGTHRLGFRGCSSLAAVHARTIEIPFQSASALEAPPRVNVGQFVGAGAVAPAASARSRSQWCRLHRPGLVVVALPIRVFQRARPNPSIEGTCNIRLRRLSPAPHVKR